MENFRLFDLLHALKQKPLKEDALAAKENGITVIEDFNFEAPKTKNYAELLKNLNLSDKKTLLVLSETNNNVYLSSRNLERCKVVTVSELNTYDIMNATNLILAESSVAQIEKTLS